MGRRRAKKKKPVRRRRIRAHDPNIIRVDAVMEGDEPCAPCWVHTHGLEAFGLPELEMRGVTPRFLLPAAEGVLRDIADYLLNSGRHVQVTDTMLGDDGAFFQFRTAEAQLDHIDHYDHDRWTISDLPDVACPFCLTTDDAEDDQVGWAPQAKQLAN